MAQPDWPYPRWIAHRGAGKLAPENTLAAFAFGLDHGYRMAECDVKLSRDGVLFLLHDATLDRTTNGHGPAGTQDWAALARLDAGGWHSSPYAGEKLPTLDQLIDFCAAHRLLMNLEIKPSPGADRATGEAVARAVAARWPAGLTAPVLSSFSREALAAAQAARPEQRRALLLDKAAPDWREAAEQLGCQAICAHFSLWTDAFAAEVKAAGLRRLTYTVNDEAVAARLLALGLDGLITDRVDLFRP